jgi:hypothetical protein
VVIVNDVRIYLNSIKKIVGSIKDAGIPGGTPSRWWTGKMWW